MAQQKSIAPQIEKAVATSMWLSSTASTTALSGTRKML